MNRNFSTWNAPNLMLLANLGIGDYDYEDSREEPYEDPEIQPGDIPVALYSQIARYCNTTRRRLACDVLADLRKPTERAEEMLQRGMRLRAIQILEEFGVLTTPELEVPAINLVKRLDLSTRIRHMLENYYSGSAVRDLAEDVKYTDLTNRIRNFGRKSERELRSALESTGILSKV